MENLGTKIEKKTVKSKYNYNGLYLVVLCAFDFVCWVSVLLECLLFFFNESNMW